MPLPNFVLAGTPKSGTTSLFHYLKEHPQIYMCHMKRPNFFAYDPTNPAHINSSLRTYPIRSLEEYSDLFSPVKDEAVVGEATDGYFTIPYVPSRMKEIIPDAYLLFALRDPVARLYSRFVRKSARFRHENLDVYEVCRPGGELANFFRYSPHFERWLNSFDRQQMIIVLLEDLIKSPVSTLQSVYRRLEVDDRYEPDISRSYNVGGLPASSAATSTWSFFARKISSSRLWPMFAPIVDSSKYRQPKFLRSRRADPIPEDLAAELKDFYKDDVMQLQNLLGIDLSIWGYSS